MVNVGIVILNYVSYDVTINCVEWFKKQNSTNVKTKIIIVDNDSPNNSFNILKEKFQEEKDVKVVKTDHNLGFANGNNYGYKKLLEFMSPDFVIVSNSDAYVEKPGLYEWIEEEYDKYKFGVLGPAIFSVNGNFYQSPINNFSRNMKEIKRYKNELKIGIVKSYIKKLLKLSTQQKIDVWDNPYYKDYHMDKTLHGAFQVFSKKYFDYYDLPYDSNTFLYMEEYILRLRCEKYNLPMVYSPKYEVKHLQAVSTNRVTKTNSARMLFKRKHMLQSLNAYVKFLENNFD